MVIPNINIYFERDEISGIYKSLNGAIGFIAGIDSVHS